MSRSGTKWLSMCLNQHSEIAVFGETGFWGKDYIHTEDGRWTPQQCRAVLQRMPGIRERRTDEQGRLYVEGQATPIGASTGGLNGLFSHLEKKIVSEGEKLAPREVFNKMCSIVSNTSGKKCILEKTPHHINWIDRIISSYPNSKFMVTYRNPYGFMRSYKHQGDRKNKEIEKSYKKLYHPIGCSMIYRGYARSIIRAKSLYPEKILSIPLESINEEPKSVLKKSCRFLGFSYEKECLLQKINSSFPKNEKELNEVEITCMNWISKREIRRLGYQKRNSDVSVSELLRMLAGVPKWGIDVWKHLRKHQNASVVKYITRWLS